MRISAISLALGFLCTASPGRTIIDPDFESPPNEFRPKFRYWLPDASVPADIVRQDIASIAAVGGGGVEFLPFYFYGLPTGGDPPTDWAKFGFGTPAFKALFQAALEEAKTRNLLLDVGQGASQGQGVPSDPSTPGLAVELAYSTADVLSGNSFDDLLPPPVAYNFLPGGFMHEPERFGKPELKAVLAGAVDEISVTPGGWFPVSQIVLNEASVLDLTPQVADGRLSWTAPAGNATWKLIAVYEKYTNQRSCAAATGATDVIANGSWIVDHFSAAGAKRITDFWDTTLLDIEEMKLLVSDVVKYFWEDSMEMQAALYWTPSLIQRFSRDRGYDLTRYLPLLFDISNQWDQYLPPYNETWVYGANGSSVKAAVLADYRKTLTEGNQEYLRHFVDWSYSLGVEYSSQPGYNIPVDMSAVIPILDAPETESLGFPAEDDMRQFSGPALFAGKSIVSNEVGAVRGASYSQTVPELLGLFKTSFATGISMQVIHGFGYTGEFPRTNWPGFNAFGYVFTEMWNNKTPAWNHFQDVMDFAARNMLILQRGTPKVDIAGYYYPAPFDLKPGLLTETLNRLGFSYDYLGPENLSPNLEVEDGTLAPSKSSYRALVFTNTTAISGYTVKAITTYAEKGLPVFFVGGVPSACRGVNECPDGEPAELLQGLMRDHTNVQEVRSAEDLPVAFDSAGVVPRVSFASAPDNWYSTWRRANDSSEDYVFFFNAGQAAATHSTSFDVNPALIPSVLDAWTGKRTAVFEYQQTEKGIVIPISLQPNQSRIYVFSKQLTGGGPSVHVKSWSGFVEGLSVGKNAVLEAQVSGPANLTLSDGRFVNIDTNPIRAQEIDSWNLTVTSYVPASNGSTAVEFEYLQRSVQPCKPWTEIEGLASVSGVGEYTSTFEFPYNPDELGAFISFGPVKDTLRAWINDQQLPSIDVTDSRVDVAEFIRQGTNTLRVNVTSTLFNAVKARVDTILLLGVPVGQINPFYDSTPLAEFGLIGPVILQPVQRIPLNATA